MKKISVRVFYGNKLEIEEYFVLEETEDHMVIKENPCPHGYPITLKKDYDGNFTHTNMYGFFETHYYYRPLKDAA